MTSCEICHSNEAFDLYLGKMVCRSCKRDTMAQEYRWDL